MSLAARVLGELERGGRVRAFLGPTNTGKTHRAIQAMLRHRSGMLGLPLRLLAQEVYARVVLAKGVEQVALVTGEQKRVPPGARYWICTVEAMPLDRPVAFLGVDEIQLAADRSRGHVFTDRILHARGVLETVFLGSSSVAPLLGQLVPGIEVEEFPRLSKLSWSGSSRMGGLPRRSAVVAFSAEKVYALAERLRARHGGVAVVLGALSPRARNAQVELFEGGTVQHLVATDAIGMGLNLDLDHVAFTGTCKFDGHGVRELSPAELAQIAGRAGRFRRDGSFGVLNTCDPLDPGLIEAIEQHRFAALRTLYWRNSDLDLDSVAGLLTSLERKPPRRFLRQVRDGVDHRALQALTQRPELRGRLRGPETVRLLWDVCGIPDYRKTLTDSHAALLSQILVQILDRGALPEAWVTQRLESLDRVDGDIEALMTRLAWTRTWSYISQRRSWLEHPEAWQERTRALEDRLSEALHDKLTQRFIESRPVVLMQLGEVDERAEGELRGLRYVPLRPGGPLPRGQLRADLVREVQSRLDALVTGPDADILLDEAGLLIWQGAAVARLQPGSDLLHPRVKLDRNGLLDPPARERLRLRLEGWLRATLQGLLHPLRELPGLDPGGRGALHALRQGLGSCPRRGLPELTRRDRRLLARRDVRIGVSQLYVGRLLKPDPMHLRAALWALSAGQPRPDLPRALEVPAEQPRGFYEAIGYRVMGRVALRVDELERRDAERRAQRRASRTRRRASRS